MSLLQKSADGSPADNLHPERYGKAGIGIPCAPFSCRPEIIVKRYIIYLSFQILLVLVNVSVRGGNCGNTFGLHQFHLLQFNVRWRQHSCRSFGLCVELCGCGMYAAGMATLSVKGDRISSCNNFLIVERVGISLSHKNKTHNNHHD